MPTTIYKITNTVNRDFYIGKTIQPLSRRWMAHRSAARGHKIETHLYRAMRKYGTEHFTVSVIEECQNGNEREMFWIELLRPPYNMTGGGDGMGSPTLETRQRMSRSRMGISPWNKGIPWSAEWRQKASKPRSVKLWWWNNGTSNTRGETCPGLGWTFGYLNNRSKA